MELRPYQQAARQAIHAEWDQGRRKTLLVLPTGCHAWGSQLLMADGTLKHVQDIEVGEYLMGPDGTPRTVLHLTRGHGMRYLVNPIKGAPFIVTGDHKLTLVRTSERRNPQRPSEHLAGEMVDVAVEEWRGWPKSKKHLYKLIRCPGILSFSVPDCALPVDPYFLGILLGDSGMTTTINVTTPDLEVAKELCDQAFHYGMQLKTIPAGKATTYIFTGQGVGCKGSELHQDLKALGLRRLGSATKHVPQIYKTAPMSARLQMIAGLLDSDGSLACNGYDFISKSKQLAKDLAFICRSVGLAAYVTPCFKSCGDFTGEYHRVSISGHCDIIPVRVPHKQAGPRKQKKDVLRTGFFVEKWGNGDYYGFTVDGDNRYLLDDFTITHNCGKTIVFAKVSEDQVRAGERVLILAHRGELLEQAADKIQKACKLGCSVEKAEQSSLGEWYRITVGSVQTLMREKRLQQFDPAHFGTIIVDEAHHVLSDSYIRILEYFSEAKLLGVTATPDRGDMRNLGQVFESLAYEYTLPRAIKDGFLCPIKAQTIPLELDLRGVGTQAGDYKASDLGSALDPYLFQIAAEMKTHCAGRKTVVFLPLVKTSQKFRDILCSEGFAAAEVNGNSRDREEILRDFDESKYDVLCNSMLLTEGWDCPTVDCIVVLRPTKVRSLYAQMVGRGTRLAPGKTELLLLDFLWHTEKHDLVRPAHLICESAEVADKVTEQLEAAGCPVDLEEAEQQAQEDVVADREAALAKKLAEMRSRQHKLVDPLQFEMSIQAEDLSSYVPTFDWERAPASDKRLAALEKYGIFPDEVECAGKAGMLLDRLAKRRDEGLTTPKQIRILEQKGFQHVGSWEFEGASKLISRIASNGWRVPSGIDPYTYTPPKQEALPWF